MFQCDMCGACCRHIGGIPGMEAYDRGDGTCRHLQGNRCSIYNARPLACRVDAMYSRVFSRSMTREQYYEMTNETCKKLKDEECKRRETGHSPGEQGRNGLPVRG